MVRITGWYSTLLLIYSQCCTPCLNVSLSNCNKYFLTALGLILEMADDFTFPQAVRLVQGWDSYAVLWPFPLV